MNALQNIGLSKFQLKTRLYNLVGHFVKVVIWASLDHTLTLPMCSKYWKIESDNPMLVKGNLPFSG